MSKGDGPPITPEQIGLPKVDTAAGQATGRDGVAVQDAAAPHDTAATLEQPSIEKLKAELFDISFRN